MSDFFQRLVKIAGTSNQSEIARKLNVPNTTLSGWITRGVSKAGAIKIADTYGVDIDYVLTGNSGVELPIARPTKQDETINTSTIRLMETLRDMERSGELTPQVVGLLNVTLDTIKGVSNKSSFGA